MSEKIDVVAIYDSQFRQLFEGVEIMDATVQEDSKIFTHPLETGVSITDHRIILPIEIDLTLIMEAAYYRDVYQQIRTFFHSNDTAIVQTKTDAYASMALASMPHEERAEMIDAIPIRLHFVLADFITTQFQSLPPAKVRDKRSASTVKRGEQQKGSEKSVAAGGVDWIKSKL